MLNLITSFSNKFLFGETIDDLATRCVRSGSRFLPINQQMLLTEEYLIQAKTSVLWLSMTGVLIASFYNPFLNPKLSLGLGLIGIVPLNVAFYKNAHLHVKEFLKEVPPKENLSAIAVLVGLTAILVIGACFTKDKSLIPQLLASSNVTLIELILISTSMINDNKYSIDRLAEAQIKVLKPKRDLLEKKIRYLDAFIKARPELYRTCKHYAETNPRSILKHSRDDITNLNPADPINYECILGLQINYFNFTLKERQDFILRYPEVQKCFKKYIARMKEEKKIMGTGVVSERELFPDVFDKKSRIFGSVIRGSF